MFEPSTLESIQIYLCNLSVYYVLSILISCISIAATIYYKSSVYVLPEETADTSSSVPVLPEDSTDEAASPRLERRGTPEKLPNPSILMDVSPVMVKEFLRADIPSKILTKDQRENERLIEEQQLENIFKLLSNQEEINSMSELQDQMRLYKKSAED